MMSLNSSIKLDKLLYGISDSASITGQSKKVLRAGCKSGEIPHIRIGEGENARFMINLPMYLEQLNRQSQECQK